MSELHATIKPRRYKSTMEKVLFQCEVRSSDCGEIFYLVSFKNGYVTFSEMSSVYDFIKNNL